MLNNLQDAIEDLKLGKPIILVDNEDRENEGDIVFAAQFANFSNMELLINVARGLICVPMTLDIADKLALSPMVVNNTDPHQTAFTVSVDAFKDVTTGISLEDRLRTIISLGDPKSLPEAFRRPGHIFPLIAKSGGVLERAGHTEGSVDLLKMAGLYPVSVICEILNQDGTMARLEKDLLPLAKDYGLKIISIEQIKQYREREEIFYQEATVANLPTEYGVFQIHIFIDPFDRKEHIALSMGDIKNQPAILTRLHSSCITGDIFHSLKCDCGDQLIGAMKMIAEQKRGLVIYLNQEGRDIGLVNKIKAYALQEQGLDTVESNLALGFLPDLRSYTPAVQILKVLGVQSIDIITNNPDKIDVLKREGININTRIPSIVKEEKERTNYLKTKKDKMGHLF